MELTTLFDLAAAALASGFIVALLTQLFKWNLFKAPAVKWPVPTAIVLTIFTSAGAVYGLDLVLDGWVAYVTYAFVTLLVATQSYDLVKASVDQIKQPDPVKRAALKAKPTAKLK